MSREVEVWGDWRELGGAIRMGILRASEARGKEVFAFEYDREWLRRESFRDLDPDLQLYEGPQYLDTGDRPNFGLFLDSSPDRWGRLIMRRREAMRARGEGRREKRLQEIDFLLGVHDEQRVGGMRFRETRRGNAWQCDDSTMVTPPWTSLRELEHASWQLQRDDAEEDPQYREWLSLLMAPGSSLGGARPKAGVRDQQGELWIAKFPGRNDERDMGAWEMVAHRLAKLAGLEVAEARLEQFGGRQHTYLVRRFDRFPGTRGAERIHFASAMTLLGYNDGADHSGGVSYLELAELLIRQGAESDQDLRELWRRIVFSIAIRNTDDHLRNHGFLLTPGGWRLSPAFDLNADPDGQGLSLNITETDNSLDFEVAREVAEYFRLEPRDTDRVLGEVKQAVARWRETASELGISRSEQESMEVAFRS